MQPLGEVVLTRPWHWGIVIVGDPLADVPDVAEGQSHSSSDGAVVLHVRHAQDIDAEAFEGDWDWATATCHVRTLAEVEVDAAPDRVTVCDVVLNTPSRQLSLGDGDGYVILTDQSLRTRVVVSAADHADTRDSVLWIDVIGIDE